MPRRHPLPPPAGPQKAADSPPAVDVVRARCGSGPEELGITTPQEANPEGPMSFAPGSKGEIYVLAQINLRIQVFRG